MVEGSVIMFLWTPELVEYLLSFLDAPSILNLACAHSFTVNILQKAPVWGKMIRRTCPLGKKEDDWSLVDSIVERKREQVRALVGLLELLEDRERFSFKVGSKHNYVDLSDSENAPCCYVSPLGFLLLEEVETSQRLAEDQVVGVQVDILDEPLLYVLRQRVDVQEERVDRLHIGTVLFSNDRDVKSFSALVASTSHSVWDALDIGDDVGAEGWVELAKISQTLMDVGALWLVGGFNVSTSREALKKSRREDLRTIWEASLGGVVGGPGTLWCVTVRSQSGEAEWTEWERLEEIMYNVDGLSEEVKSLRDWLERNIN